ncbi:polysaccharide pyruvyl transferase family protein [Pseudobutyrivibrio xylanivorans]|uniref:Polysaccharide pyruvyl transferase n=1 Tax=Pseudobutyrivibrio xylanivorans TaxID=185007 RepID=A0A1G5S2C2_PSEXY|nr:polysaccharide pyruvyl transferase family protein [Pseudobutyrivibrio xylanivorans]SCZ79719.1 Polysaccharide pyruvyl transferase [Pseudobutyrivibrio xylanivorans]
MKIDVITRHAITNYGSLLQSLATQTVIEELGHECEIIDYIRADESYKEHEKTLLKNKKKWNNNPFIRFAYLALRQPESIYAGKKFEKQRNSYLKLSKRYSSRESLKQDCPKADVYMTGSDQVWGPTEDGSYDDNYCLSFVNDAKKIAYAASFGRTDMNPELRAYFTNHLSKYNHIAVREDSAVKMLEDFNIKAEQVLDPTLLFEKDFWLSYTEDICRKKYLLVYQLHNDKKLGEYAAKIAKEKGLELIRVSASFHQINRPGKLILCPSVAEFLGYVKNATLMVTDSFHGTAFAINFNTPFVEVLPNNKTGTRNMSILALTGLSDRILSDDNLNVAEKEVDFSYANKILAEKRRESKEILRKMIEE